MRIRNMRVKYQKQYPDNGDVVEEEIQTFVSRNIGRYKGGNVTDLAQLKIQMQQLSKIVGLLVEEYLEKRPEQIDLIATMLGVVKHIEIIEEENGY